jgi:hypothetical protein
MGNVMPNQVVGRAQVRSTLAAFIAPPSISGINQVFTSFPKRINFQVNALPSQINRCAAVIFIESETETRIANGGVSNGWKRIDYIVALQLFHHSLAREAEDAMQDLDEIIDDLKELLRSGLHRLSDESGILVWQAAEPNIDVTYGEPLSQNGTSTETWATMRFTVTQMIQA